MSVKYWFMPRTLRPQTVGSKATPPYGLLIWWYAYRPETSVDVLLLSDRVAKKRIQHVLSVLQWFVGKHAS